MEYHLKSPPSVNDLVEWQEVNLEIHFYPPRNSRPWRYRVAHHLEAALNGRDHATRVRGKYGSCFHR